MTDDGEKWEFGSLEWCQWCGELGVRLIEDAKLDLTGFEWGFSEIYTHIPERLLAGRDQAAYYFMVTGGNVSGGAGAPAECLALPGFHVVARWGVIAHPSSFIYGAEGQRARMADQETLYADLEEVTGRPNPMGRKPRNDIWPKEIQAAVRINAEHGGGLHNLTAKKLKLSPEVKDLPQTEWGVPSIGKMNAEQRDGFLRLIGL